MPPDIGGPTGIPGGKFISGEALSQDSGSSFKEGSEIWQFDAEKYPQLKSMAGLDAAKEAVQPRPGGYIDAGETVYDGAPISVGGTAGSDVRYWLFGGYMLTSMEFKKLDQNPTDSSVGATTPGGAPAAAGTYYLLAKFTGGSETIKLKAQFTIGKRTLTEADFNADELTRAEVYTESAVTKTVTCADGLTLSEGTDYTVVHANNVDLTSDSSKAMVTISAAGSNCTGTVTFSFDICVGEAGEGRVVPLTSGIYRLGEAGSWTCGDDPTTYCGGVPVYLEQGIGYDFTKQP